MSTRVGGVCPDIISTALGWDRMVHINGRRAVSETAKGNLSYVGACTKKRYHIGLRGRMLAHLVV